MSKLELSPRLYAAARFAEQGRRIVDIGTDHGRLPVWLALRGFSDGITATDVRRRPLESAVRSAREYGVGDRIRFVLCDGLSFEGAKDSDTVIIAGMGGETIWSILERASWTKTGVRLILQPQSKLDELCAWLNIHGYLLNDAALAEDAGRLYVILSVSGAGGGAKAPVYAEDALMENCDPLLPRWLDWRISVLSDAVAGMSWAKENIDRTPAREALARLIRVREEMETWQP